MGAGPAGVSGALWARSLDLEPLVIEAAERLGGQLHEIHFHPRELPGTDQGDGAEIARRFDRQLAEAGVEVRFGVAARALEARNNRIRTLLDGGATLEARAVLVTSGTRRRRLEVPGEEELAGRGVFGSARREIERLAGKRVAVIGGGDGAFENALILTGAGCQVVLIVRGEPTARSEFRQRVQAHPAVEIVSPATVLGFSGGEGAVQVAIEGPLGHETLEVDGAVVKVGRQPESLSCPGLERDSEGYVVVDTAFRTSVHGIWAAGDVIRPARPSIAAAIGTAGLALADIRRALRDG